MVKIKICGIRREEDIEIVNKYRPNYVGFVFAKSKRQVDIYKAEKLADKLDVSIKKVGVFVNEDIEKVKEVCFRVKLDIVQLHGDENEEYIDKLKGFKVWKAVNVTAGKDVEKFKNYRIDAFLVDGYDGTNRGGTGKSFNWNLLKENQNKILKPIIAAGGLNIDNVEKCIEVLNPFAVDVSSGVETDGFKDEEKIKKFIMRVRKFK
ncbi:N-(5'-phosphoribosyl)anthranilate isomerase [Clostridium acetobutylicum]|nr:N-(5'-phosphoribosyl)anthranilate isomerase [Clostridium acetobutylicum]